MTNFELQEAFGKVDRYGFEAALQYIRKYINDDKLILKEVRQDIKKMFDYQQMRMDVAKLHELPRWAPFARELLMEMANSVDIVFVKTMRSLYCYKYDAVQMHRWWRAIKAANQHHILTYLNHGELAKRVNPGESLHPDVIYTCCFRTQEALEFGRAGLNAHTVELTLRGHLEISMVSDIDIAWREWAKRNHPDRGGNTSKFTLVKAAYEEWKEIEDGKHQ